MDAIADASDTITQSVPWQRSATLLALAFACTAEYWTTASVSLTLTDLGGTLGASSDEASWALTIYTTAFAVAIALSHRLSVYFGNRKYLGTCALLYGLASIACAFSPNLPVFLSFRALQGFAGGVFLVRTFVFFTQRIEPERRASMAISFFIEVFLVGRLIPYVASGWVADNITWRLEFVVPALFMFAAAGLFFTFTADHWRQADNTGERVDVAGIVLLAVGATALQVVLSRGEIDDWFGSPFICYCFGLGMVANALFVFWQLSSKNQSPLLDLRYMKERSVYAGGILGLALGFLLSGSLYVIPQYLRTVESHSALQTGVLLGVSSAGAAIALWALQYMQPLVKRLGSRLILAIAFITAMLSEFMFGRLLTPDTPDYMLWIPLFLNGVFIAVSVPTLGGAAFALVAEQETSSARAIFYGLRQFGTSMGVAVALILIDRRSQLHSGRLLERFFGRSLAVISQSSEFSPESLRGLEAVIRKQSLVLSFADVFNFMALIAGLSLLAIPLLPKLRPLSKGAATGMTPMPSLEGVGRTAER
ncbi:MFS transporter [Tunturiibacter empetritectus]|uniref:EmrB/QacA subfamily drug resistance transporter n=1 Tax=Tunturiibacter lichenicola TaxID=2051959 RepID=A0A852VED0_9BACT|nr:EmrB/QacA subfamily drug resistance transporter [Edaphobacter lichenicola]